MPGLSATWSHTGLYRSWPLGLITALCIAINLAPQPPALELSRTIKAELAAGQSHDYQFHLSAGGYARVVIEQHTVDIAVACFGPNGQRLFTVDTQVVGDAETVDVTAEDSGAYRLQITPSEPRGPSGRYEITIRELGAVTERHKLRIAAARALTAGTSSRRLGTREAFLRAIAEVEKALAYWRAAQDRIEEANALLTIGLLYVEIGDRARALGNTSDALVVARSTPDRRITGRALEAIARVHNSFGDKRKAIEYCEQALPLLRAVGDRSGEGNALDNLAVALSGIGEKRRALTYFDQSLQIFRALQDRQLIAELAGNIGLTYDRLGEYRRALESHRNSLVLVRQLADRPTEAVAMNNIGSAYSGLGDYQNALDAYTAARDLNQALGNQWNVAINLNNIAWVYGQLGNRRQALRLYARSLELLRAAKDRRRIASVLSNIGDIYTEFGNYRKAVESHTEALSLRRAAGDREGEANSLNNLGRCYARFAQRAMARDYFERALAIHRSLENRYMLTRTLRSVAVLDRENGDVKSARSLLGKALQISQAIRDRKGQAEALSELAKVERDRGNFAQARDRAEEALTALESIRLAVMSPALRASLIASARDVQELQIEMLMRLHAQEPDKGFATAALLASERGRARSLLEALAELGADIRSGADPGLLTRESELERLISAKADLQTRLLSGKHTDIEAARAQYEVDALMMELDQVQSRIRASSPHYAALTSPAALDLTGLQTSVVDDDTVLLEYALGARKSFLWVVSPSSMNVFELPSRSEIESVGRRIYDLLTARNQNPAGEKPAARSARLHQADKAYFVAARKASRILLGPAAARIRNKRLLIVRDGILQYLPFGALPEPGTNTPLIVNHEIVTAPSASVIAVLRQVTAVRTPAEKALAVLADPVFSADDARVARAHATSGQPAAGQPAFDPDAPDFVRLRFSRTEAEEITRLAGASATLRALDFDASRDTAMQPELRNYRIVHFATHTVINNQHPDLSGVVLSLIDRTGRSQNGFLRLSDIYNLRLGAELVVLSACRTALGEEVRGEGLIGLTRAFLYAGAPSVVATLWDIDDRATAEAMKLFYEGMLAHAERPSEALRRAQIAMWSAKGREAPYYWAAFTLEGEWR